MEKNDEQLKLKQELLQREILDKNYDQNKFIEFCLNKKENGDDLNGWTLEQLQQVVSEFIKEVKEEISTSNSIKENENQEEVKKENIDKMESMNADSQQQFQEKVINCRKLEKTQLNGNMISVTISEPTEMDGGLIYGKYIVYKVITDPFGWNVQRRYSDFDWLRQLLIKFYPGFNIPPLPKKNASSRRFETDFVMKRMKFLELFINNVIENESFKANEFIVAFLSYEDRNKYEAKMKEFSSVTPSNYVEDYKTLDGKAIISLDNGNEKYFRNIWKFFNLQESVLTKLNGNLKLFYNHIIEATNALSDAEQNFEVLHLLNTKVLMKENITRTYEELHLFLQNWRKILIKQNILVKNQIKDFFKYINLEGKSYSYLIERRQDLKVKYMEELGRLNLKKDRLFNAKDISKFELDPNDKNIDNIKLVNDKKYAFDKMCYQETRLLDSLSNQLGYANKMNIFELKKMIKNYDKRYIMNLNKFDQEFCPTINDLLGTWTNLELFVRSAFAQYQMEQSPSKE